MAHQQIDLEIELSHIYRSVRTDEWFVSHVTTSQSPSAADRQRESLSSYIYLGGEFSVNYHTALTVAVRIRLSMENITRAFYSIININYYVSSVYIMSWLSFSVMCVRACVLQLNCIATELPVSWTPQQQLF